MNKKTLLYTILAAITLTACNSTTKQTTADKPTPATTNPSEDSIILYRSENLIILQLTPHVYQHISWLQTKDFGKVDCNGMVVVSDSQAVVFDTPASEKSSAELIQYLSVTKNIKINAIVPTHFHEDCVAGLEAFMKDSIPCIASNKTIAFLKNKGRTFSRPMQGFNDSIVLTAGTKKLDINFYGEGHTKDNIIAYFPDDQAVFGGCLIKETGATKGNLADANVAAWSQTVKKIKQRYPATRIVIPGHGKSGGTELFDYTIQLFEKSEL